MLLLAVALGGRAPKWIIRRGVEVKWQEFSSLGALEIIGDHQTVMAPSLLEVFVALMT